MLFRIALINSSGYAAIRIGGIAAKNHRATAGKAQLFRSASEEGGVAAGVLRGDCRKSAAFPLGE